jgi:hypothetical protein
MSEAPRNIRPNRTSRLIRVVVTSLAVSILMLAIGFGLGYVIGRAVL